jgi:Uma2 family endonuclease
MSVRAKMWTREEYDRLVAAGGFAPESRVQLIRGEIVEMAPQGTRHATSILLTDRALRRSLAQGFTIRAQLPLALGQWSEPEPDVAVVLGAIEDYRDTHPENAVLVVEVADSTLEFDRTRKLEAYAEAGIREYWIVNLVEGVLEVYRDPSGPAYRESRRVGRDDVLSPITAPTGAVRVSDLLP